MSRGEITKLALIASGQYPPVAGAGARLIRLFGPMSKNHDIHIFSIGPHIKEDKDFRHNTFWVHTTRLPAEMPKLEPKIRWGWNISWTLGPFLSNITRYYLTRRLKRTEKFDAIFSYEPNFLASLALSASEKLLIPLFCDYPDFELHSDNVAYKAVIVNMLKGIFKKSKHMFPISQPLKDRLINFYGVPKNKITIISNGVDTNMFNPNVDGSEIREKFNLSDFYVIGYCGILDRWTRLDVLFYAFKKLKKNYNVKLLVIGTGSEINKWKTLSKNLKIEKDVIFTGLVPYDEVPKYIASFDVAVSIFMKSFMAEAASPLKVIEYMSMGKAVVADNLQGTKDFVTDMKDGILFKVEDSKNVEIALRKILDDKRLKNKLERNARKKALCHSWQTLSKKMEKVLLNNLVTNC